MHDMTQYLAHFFMGPFPDRAAAIVASAKKHGERSVVVGLHADNWWVKPWRAENFHQDRWPQGFEFVDRFDVGIAKVKSVPSFRVSFEPDRLDTIRSLFGRKGSEAVTEDFDFNFANWLADEDFNIRLPEKADDISIASTTAGADDEVFFRILSEHPILPSAVQLLGRKDGRK